MGKKRDRDSLSKEDAKRDPDAMDEDSSSDEDFDIVNVDFEWFNFDPTIDFHGTKTLLRQLLDVDSPLFDTSALADLILSNTAVGSTVKVDGKETDAYALITALPLSSQRAKHTALDALAEYIASKAAASPATAPVAQILEKDAKADVGLVVSERLINMPSEVAGPLYAMLVDELDDAVSESEPYDFSHVIVLSRVYREVLPDPEVREQEEGDERRRKTKKQKGGSAAQAGGEGEVFYFHPEDEVFMRFAEAKGSFAFTKEGEAVADSKRAFQDLGVKTEGFVMLFTRDKFREGVKAVGEFLKGSS